jgi:hypothetical protein
MPVAPAGSPGPADDATPVAPAAGPTDRGLALAVAAGLGFLLWYATWGWTIKTLWQTAGLPDYATFGRFFRLWLPLASALFALTSILFAVGDRAAVGAAVRREAGLSLALFAFLLMQAGWPRPVPLWIWLGGFFVAWVALRGALLLWPLRRDTAVRPGRRAAARVFAGSLLVYGLLVPWVAMTLPLAGDEPHYLLIAHSLLVDHDVDLRNNFERADYQAFHPGHLSPQGTGDPVSAHGVGFPLLLLPGYAVGGRLGATWLMAGLAALLSLNIYWFCRELAGSPGAALQAWALTAFTVPLLIYAHQLFPESAAALAALYAHRRLRGDPTAPPRSRLRALLATFGLVVVKIRYAPVAAVLWAQLLLRERREARRIGWWALALLAFVVTLVVADRFWLGGSLLLTRFGSRGAWLHLVAPNRYHVVGLLGLLFDQKAGLLVYSPVYLFALIGLAVLLRDRRPDGLVILGTSAVYLYVLIAHAEERWHGEFSPSPRYLVVLLPLLAGPMAVAFARCRGRGFDAARVILGAYSLAIAVVLVVVPRWRFRTRTGQNTLLAVVSQALPGDLAGWFPSFIVPTGYALTVGGIGLVLLAALVAYACATTACRPGDAG